MAPFLPAFYPKLQVTIILPKSKKSSIGIGTIPDRMAWSVMTANADSTESDKSQSGHRGVIYWIRNIAAVQIFTKILD